MMRLWIETTHHAAFRYGGWGFVRQVDGAVSGMAGGERNITAQRLDLNALIAVLAGLPNTPVTLNTASSGLLAIGRYLADPAEPPAEDLDLWAQLAAAAKARPIAFRAVPQGKGTTTAFLAAWAEVGQDKAKSKGRFSAAIPKPNLAKLALS